MTDTLYGDIDDDGCPDISVGRLPVKNMQELKVQIEKVFLRSESMAKASKPKIVIWAGAGGYTNSFNQVIGNYSIKYQL